MNNKLKRLCFCVWQIDDHLQSNAKSASNLDIRDYIQNCRVDEIKYSLIQTRVPEQSFQFPPKQYKDKRSSTGFFQRFCNRQWFQTFDFISYSRIDDGLYCVACVLFPDRSHHRSSYLISEPYRNWKDAMQDFKSHAVCEYHINSAAKLQAFVDTYETTVLRIDLSMTEENAQIIQRNHEVLRSILKCVHGVLW